MLKVRLLKEKLARTTLPLDFEIVSLEVFDDFFDVRSSALDHFDRVPSSWGTATLTFGILRSPKQVRAALAGASNGH